MVVCRGLEGRALAVSADRRIKQKLKPSSVLGTFSILVLPDVTDHHIVRPLRNIDRQKDRFRDYDWVSQSFASPQQIIGLGINDSDAND